MDTQVVWKFWFNCQDKNKLNIAPHIHIMALVSNKRRPATNFGDEDRTPTTIFEIGRPSLKWQDGYERQVQSWLSNCRLSN